MQKFLNLMGYNHPCWLPTMLELITIGNNVTIAADVRLCEHDMVRLMFDNDPSYNGPYIKYYTGPIEIEDNVVIGARSIILYNIKVGRNALIAAGSVVIKNVPPYSIVVGKVVGDTKQPLYKRLKYSGVEVTDYSFEEYYRK